ncbi:MAG: hypothetical protein QXL24_00795, partial [Candidatus Jordarchaeaceae archaeon]
MWKKAELIKVFKKISSPETDSPLHEVCKWCGWYQKLETKSLFGSRVRRPHKNCPRCGCPTRIIADEILYGCAL